MADSIPMTMKTLTGQGSKVIKYWSQAMTGGVRALKVMYFQTVTVTTYLFTPLTMTEIVPVESCPYHATKKSSSLKTQYLVLTSVRP